MRILTQVVHLTCLVLESAGARDKWWTIGPTLSFGMGEKAIVGIGIESSWYYTIGDAFLVGPNLGIELMGSEGLNIYSQVQGSIFALGQSIGPAVQLSLKDKPRILAQFDICGPFVFRRSRGWHKEEAMYWGGYFKDLNCYGINCPEGLPGWN